jgi:hypothetical protein
MGVVMKTMILSLLFLMGFSYVAAEEKEVNCHVDQISNKINFKKITARINQLDGAEEDIRVKIYFPNLQDPLSFTHCTHPANSSYTKFHLAEPAKVRYFRVSDEEHLHTIEASILMLGPRSYSRVSTRIKFLGLSSSFAQGGDFQGVWRQSPTHTRISFSEVKISSIESFEMWNPEEQ